MDQVEEYEIEISFAAQNRYRDEILTYLLEHFSFDRTQEIDDKIFQLIKALAKFPFRGTIEPLLSRHRSEFRFILFKETRYFELKIVYIINPEVSKVFVTDFFPVKKNPTTLKLRN